MRSMPVLVLASLNRGKQDEFRELLAQQDLKLGVISEYVRNADFLGAVENKLPNASYLENATKKCHAAFQAAKVPTFADDSGIEIDALNGEPGVHSAHFAKPTARESQDQANRRAILEKMKGRSDRRARMRCVLVFQVEGKQLSVEGVCEGKIAEREQGNGGFGFDPIFLPEGAGGKSFAELSTEEKNKISHRASAVTKLAAALKEHEIELVRP